MQELCWSFLHAVVVSAQRDGLIPSSDRSRHDGTRPGVAGSCVSRADGPDRAFFGAGRYLIEYIRFIIPAWACLGAP